MGMPNITGCNYNDECDKLIMMTMRQYNEYICIRYRQVHEVA